MTAPIDTRHAARIVLRVIEAEYTGQDPQNISGDWALHRIRDLADFSPAERQEADAERLAAMDLSDDTR